MKIEWNIFKEFVDGRKISIQYIDLGNQYWLKGFDGNFELECYLSKLEATDFETNYKAAGNQKLDGVPPFASKTIGIKKLYKRIHGIVSNLEIGENEIFFSIPYPWIKITGLEIVGCAELDKVSLFVLDSAIGSYTTIPNYILNQFGFNVNLSKDYYVYKSEFDADLYQGMQVLVVYHSLSDKTIGINLILNEVK